jgi:hypothetical protein
VKGDDPFGMGDGPRARAAAGRNGRAQGFLEGAAIQRGIDAGSRDAMDEIGSEASPPPALTGNLWYGTPSAPRVVSWKHFLDGNRNRTYDLI